MHPLDDTAGTPWDLDPGDLLRVLRPAGVGDGHVPFRYCHDVETAVETLRVDRCARVVHLPRGFDGTPAWGIVGREDDDVFLTEGPVPEEVARWCRAHPERVSTARGFRARGVLVREDGLGPRAQTQLTARGWVPEAGGRGAIVVTMGGEAPSARTLEVSLEPAALAGVLQRWGAVELDLTCSPELRIEDVHVTLAPTETTPSG